MPFTRPFCGASAALLLATSLTDHADAFSLNNLFRKPARPWGPAKKPSAPAAGANSRVMRVMIDPWEASMSMRKHRELKRVLEQAEAEKSDLRSRLASVEKLARARGHDLQTLKQELAEANDKWDASHRDLSSQLESAQAHAQELGASMTGLQAELTRTQGKAAEEVARVDDLKRALVAAEETASKKGEEWESTHQRLSEAQLELESLRAVHHDSKTAEEGRVRELVEIVDRLKLELVQAKQDLTAAVGTKEALEEQLFESAQYVEKMQAHISTLVRERAAEQERSVSLEQRLKKEEGWEAKYAMVRSELEGLQEEVQRLRGAERASVAWREKSVRLEKEVEGLREQREEWERRCVALRKDVKDLHEVDRDVRAWKEKSAALEREVERLRREEEGWRSEIEGLQREIDELKGREVGVRRKYEGMKHVEKALRSQIDVANQVGMQVDAELEVSQRQLGALRDQVMKMEGLKHVEEVLRAQLESAHRLGMQTNAELQRSREKVDQLTQQLDAKDEALAFIVGSMAHQDAHRRRGHEVVEASSGVAPVSAVSRLFGHKRKAVAMGVLSALPGIMAASAAQGLINPLVSWAIGTATWGILVCAHILTHLHAPRATSATLHTHTRTPSPYRRMLAVSLVAVASAASYVLARNHGLIKGLLGGGGMLVVEALTSGDDLFVGPAAVAAAGAGSVGSAVGVSGMVGPRRKEVKK